MLFIPGHQAYEPGSETLKRLVEAFGSHILTDAGEVNRKALGAIIFKDPVKSLI